MTRRAAGLAPEQLRPVELLASKGQIISGQERIPGRMIANHLASESGSTKLTRGADIASCTFIRKSIMFITICGTVCPMV